MIVAPLHPDEPVRQYTLDCLHLLDTAADAYLDTLVRIAKGAFGVEIALISLIDRDRQWFKAKQGTDLAETARDIAFCSHTILEPHSLIVPDALDDPRFRGNPLVAAAPRVRLYAGHPIRVNGYPIGTLCLLHPEPRQLSGTEQEMLVDLATLAEGYVVQRIQNTHIRTLYEVLDTEHLRTMTDSLTQSWNRAGLAYQLPALLNEAAASGKQVGVLCCDLDRFKAVNDVYGHSVGDHALVQSAQRLKATLRVDDLLIRMGGEEFGILALVNHPEELLMLARRANLAIANAPLICSDIYIAMTISIGSAIKRAEESIEATFERADKALYRAKLGGRNRIEKG